MVLRNRKAFLQPPDMECLQAVYVFGMFLKKPDALEGCVNQIKGLEYGSHCIEEDAWILVPSRDGTYVPGPIDVG